MAMELQKERLSILQAPGVFFQEHIFGSGMKIIVLLADITEVSEMMLVLIAKSRIHLVPAVWATKSMTSTTLTFETCNIYYLIRIIQ